MITLYHYFVKKYFKKDNFFMNFSERLRTLRLNAGYTQIELAKMINLNSQGAYGKYERGVGTPQTARLEKLAEIFNVSVPYLLGETDIPLPDDEPLCLPKRLKELRFEIGYTQKKLAEAIDCSPSVYLTWENGTRTPKTQALEKIALFYQVSVSYLLCETNIRSFSEIENLLEELSDSEQKKVIAYIKSIHGPRKVINNFVSIPKK